MFPLEIMLASSSFRLKQLKIIDGGGSCATAAKMVCKQRGTRGDSAPAQGLQFLFLSVGFALRGADKSAAKRFNIIDLTP